MNIINEVTRNELISKSKKGAAYKDPKKGNRWTAKSKSKVANTVKEYNYDIANLIIALKSNKYNIIR